MASAVAPEIGRGQLGPSTVMRARVQDNARAVVGYAGGGPGPLRTAFLGAIENLQVLHLGLCSDEDGATPTFAPAIDETPAWLAVMVVEQLPDHWEYVGPARQEVRDKIARALNLINEQDPSTFEAINTIIGRFLMARLEHFEGGSISSLIGAIWIALDPDKPVEEFAELIVHEYVHNALFLEDMVHGVFVDGEARLGEDDALVTSAILKIPRGYDKAFHSAVVSAVLGEFQQRLGLHEKAATALEPLATTLIGLREKDDMLTDNGRRVLSELEDWVGQSLRTQTLAGEPAGVR
jgi:hypothetical protein